VKKKLYIYIYIILCNLLKRKYSITIFLNNYKSLTLKIYFQIGDMFFELCLEEIVENFQIYKLHYKF